MGGGGGGGEEAAAHEAASTLATSVVTLATMLSRAPPALPALLGAVELGAAAVALTGRQLRVCGVLLFVVAAMGASHVVLSAAYMKVSDASRRPVPSTTRRPGTSLTIPNSLSTGDGRRRPSV